jgi:hypothetical protein
MYNYEFKYEHMQLGLGPCFHVSISMSPCLWNSSNGNAELTENSMFHFFCCNGKRRRQTSVCLLQTETEVCFLGQQTIRDNRQFLFQQMCPSMHTQNRPLLSSRENCILTEYLGQPAGTTYVHNYGLR